MSFSFKRVCVFCGSNPGVRPGYMAAAKSLGTALAEGGAETVYGGGRLGLMGAVANSALAAGGRVIGVMPQSLVDMEVAHSGLTQLHIVGSMHERKALMNSLSDTFIILPGGWGTMDELCEALTWAQLQIHHKPVALWNVEGYYDSFLAFSRHAMQEGLLKAKDYERLLVSDTLAGLLALIEKFKPTYDLVPAKLSS